MAGFFVGVGEGMNHRQQRFVDEYLIDLNATQAAIRAGYAKGSAEVTGFRLLRNAKIAAIIDEKRAKAAENCEVTREWIIEQLRVNAIQCMEKGETFSPSAANKALELLGKEHRMFIDRRLLGVRNIDDMSEEELLEFLGGEPEPTEIGAAAGNPPSGNA